MHRTAAPKSALSNKTVSNRDLGIPTGPGRPISLRDRFLSSSDKFLAVVKTIIYKTMAL